MPEAETFRGLMRSMFWLVATPVLLEKVRALCHWIDEVDAHLSGTDSGAANRRRAALM